MLMAKQLNSSNAKYQNLAQHANRFRNISYSSKNMQIGDVHEHIFPHDRYVKFVLKFGLSWRSDRWGRSAAKLKNAKVINSKGTPRRVRGSFLTFPSCERNIKA
jgi:hypothetical protein